VAAHQQGVEAVLTFSYPSATAAGGALPDVEGIELWRTSMPLGQEPKGGTPADIRIQVQLIEGQGELLRTLDRRAIERATRGPVLELRDDLETWYEENRQRMPLVVWYAIRTVCCGGRVSSFSNIARLEPQPPPAPPAGLTLSPSEEGIVLTWQAEAGLSTIIERSLDGRSWHSISGDPVVETTFTDRAARQGVTWWYRLLAVRQLEGGGRVIGDPGPALELEYADSYPPPAPANVVCLPEAEIVRLRWDPVAGAVSYRIFRQREGDSWRPLGLVSSHSFEDRKPQVGNLTYAVKAVDGAGNESEASTCTTLVGHPP
jgi:hypothetical protein